MYGCDVTTIQLAGESIFGQSGASKTTKAHLLNIRADCALFFLINRRFNVANNYPLAHTNAWMGHERDFMTLMLGLLDKNSRCCLLPLLSCHSEKNE